MTNDYSPIEQSREEPRRLRVVANPFRGPEGHTASFYNIHIRSTVKGLKCANWEKLELIRPSGRANVFYGIKLFGIKVMLWHASFGLTDRDYL